MNNCRVNCAIRVTVRRPAVLEDPKSITVEDTTCHVCGTVLERRPSDDRRAV